MPFVVGAVGFDVGATTGARAGAVAFDISIGTGVVGSTAAGVGADGLTIASFSVGDVVSVGEGDSSMSSSVGKVVIVGGVVSVGEGVSVVNSAAGVDIWEDPTLNRTSK